MITDIQTFMIHLLVISSRDSRLVCLGWLFALHFSNFLFGADLSLSFYAANRPVAHTRWRHDAVSCRTAMSGQRRLVTSGDS